MKKKKLLITLLVLFTLTTGNKEQERVVVYEVDCVDEYAIADLGYNLTMDYAKSLGVTLPEDFSDKYDWKVLNNMTKAEIEKEYGKVQSLILEDIDDGEED